MGVTTVFVMLLQSIIQYPQMVGEVLDEATHDHMEERYIYLSNKMAQLLQELEQRNLEERTQEKRGVTWGSLFFAALQYKLHWVIAGLLVLLVGLWWWFRSWKQQVYNDSDHSSSEHGTEEEDDDEDDDEDDMVMFIDERIQFPVEDITKDARRALHLVHTCILLFRELSIDTFYPVLQEEIGVGSTFEGWSVCREGSVHKVLVSMLPPRGHSFRLEVRSVPRTEARICFILVSHLCTCLQPGQMCFLHGLEEELKRNQEPSLLDTLCTDSYLDVEKTARWFYQLMKAIWVILPLSAKCCLKMLPSSRSCRFQVTNVNGTVLNFEVILGVQLGKSDIFISSESTEYVFAPSVMWSQTYAVAEAKFFSHIARQAPSNTLHLKCLQIFAYIHDGYGFSIYTFKTAVMHLLTTIPLSGWQRKYLVKRLRDIMSYLHSCLEEKRLNHFFFANENMPEEILLPSSVQNAVRPNLFYHLEEDPDSFSQAKRDFYELEDRLRRFIIFGR